jgi:aryl-alcohol dehydrogenase-like predicted oxidoreductase
VHGFGRLDVSPEWGSLDGLSAAGLPAVVRVPPVVHWPAGQPPPLELAYPGPHVERVLAAMTAAGVVLHAAVLHKWDRAWVGDEVVPSLEDLRRSCASAGITAVGVACIDSDPGGAAPVAPSLDMVSVQFNLANQRAALVQAAYGDADCSVEVRAPLDAGSVLEGFFDGLPPDDVRRRYFGPYEADARRCAALVTEVARSGGLSPAELAIRWVASHPWASEICVGATSVTQVVQLAELSAAGPLNADMVERLRAADWSWRYGSETPAASSSPPDDGVGAG